MDVDSSSSFALGMRSIKDFTGADDSVVLSPSGVVNRNRLKALKVRGVVGLNSNVSSVSTSNERSSTMVVVGSVVVLVRNPRTGDNGLLFLKMLLFTFLPLYGFRSLRLYVFMVLRHYVSTSSRLYVSTISRLYVSTSSRLNVFTAPEERNVSFRHLICAGVPGAASTRQPNLAIRIG